jgi:hypothetical protein
LWQIRIIGGANMIVQGVTLKGVTVTDATIVSGSVVNLDAATGVSGSTWTNTGTLGATLNYTLFNSPTTTTVNGFTVLNFPGGAVQSPGAMTNPYAFNGTGFAAMGTSSQAFTLDIWVCPQAANAGCLIKEYGQSSGGAPSAGWEDAWINFYNGTINCSVWSYGSPVSAGSYTQNNWYCICMTYNGTNQLKTYVNGTLANTQNMTRTASNAGCMLTIAGCERYNYLGGANGYFNGYVGAFKVYYSALTAAQVAQNYNALRSRYGL